MHQITTQTLSKNRFGQVLPSAKNVWQRGLISSKTIVRYGEWELITLDRQRRTTRDEPAFSAFAWQRATGCFRLLTIPASALLEIT